MKRTSTREKALAAILACVACGAAVAALAAGRAQPPVFGAPHVLGDHALKDDATTNLFGGPTVQRNADIANDRAGAWIAVWHSTEPVGDDVDGTYDIVYSRSSDGGKTWTEKKVLSADAPGNRRDDLSPTVRTDGKGLWLVAWSARGSLGAKLGVDADLLISRSIDDGTTWSEPIALNTNAERDWGSDFDIRLTTDAKGAWVAVWSSTESFGKYGGDSDIFSARSADGGLTWSAPVVLNNNAAKDLGFDVTPDVGTDVDGALLTVWSSGDSLSGRIGIDRDIVFARSVDGGVTWTDPQPLNSQAQRDEGSDWAPRLATDSKGKWIVAWSSAVNLEGIRGGDRDILYAVSTDHGATWSSAHVLDADSNNDAREDTDPVIVTDNKGRWAVVWQAWGGIGYADGSDADVLMSFSEDDGVTWSPPGPLNHAANRDSVDDLLPTIATDRDGHWIGVWQSFFPSTGSVEHAAWRMVASTASTGDSTQ